MSGTSYRMIFHEPCAANCCNRSLLWSPGCIYPTYGNGTMLKLSSLRMLLVLPKCSFWCDTEWCSVVPSLLACLDLQRGAVSLRSKRGYLWHRCDSERVLPTTAGERFRSGVLYYYCRVELPFIATRLDVLGANNENSSSLAGAERRCLPSSLLTCCWCCHLQH